jgi:hypothetical protein
MRDIVMVSIKVSLAYGLGSSPNLAIEYTLILLLLTA